MMKFIREINCGNSVLDVGQFRARIYKDTDMDEYRVKFYYHTVHLGNKTDYFTEYKSDALGTADVCLRTLQRNHLKYPHLKYGE